ncbi:MAG: hypothetical protein AB1801_23770 [Chloroflexota bacterium]
MNISETDLPIIAENEPAPDILVSVDTPAEPDPPAAEESQTPGPQPYSCEPLPNRRSRREFLWLAATFAAGLGSGYVLRGWPWLGSSSPAAEAKTAPKTTDETEAATPAIQISLPDEYTLPVSYDDLGPRLLEAGAIDDDQFTQVYEQAGQPLSPEQRAILTAGSNAPVVINRDNAYFLLNFFWAAGLTHRNTILTEGAMMQNGAEKVGNFASTGGWTVGAKPVTELYASTLLFDLTPAQQTRLEEVAKAVYRPCCNNPTSFPDCNHGMAMLGVLELLASQDVGVAEMFEAAKSLNAFWFPQQTYELALAFNQGQGLDFAATDARELVSANFSSSTGFRAVHQWLADNNLLQQTPGGGNSCDV